METFKDFGDDFRFERADLRWVAKNRKTCQYLIACCICMDNDGDLHNDCNLLIKMQCIN